MSRTLAGLALGALFTACATQATDASPARLTERAIAPARYDATPTRYVNVAGSRWAYRSLGEHHAGPPVVLLQHFTGTMDDWDPLVVEGLAKARRVVVFDSAGVGSSAGTTPDSIQGMARATENFLAAAQLKQVDLLGFSMGGFIAQQILAERPELVRRAILVGTSPKGGAGVKETPAVISEGLQRAAERNVHPKVVLFFTDTAAGRTAAGAFLGRIGKHTRDATPPASEAATQAQLKAIVSWGSLPANEAELKAVAQPVLIVNGSNDILDLTPNSFTMFQHMPASQLVLFPDSGHGSLFQYHELFVAQANEFLSRRL